MSKQKFLTLHFKRSKLFLLAGEGHGEKRFITGPTREGAIQVPAWVAETQTYQLSIKDGSIVNLTPPEPTIIYRDAPPKDEAPKDEGNEVTEEPSDGEVAEDEDTSTEKGTPSPKPRGRRKNKADGPAGLIATTIVAQ